jgi:TonB family protein
VIYVIKHFYHVTEPTRTDASFVSIKTTTFMKKHISILALILSLVVFQGCGSKTETNKQETAEAQSAENKSIETVSSRRAKLAKARAEKAEQRSRALEARTKLSMTYTDASGKLVFHKAEVDPSYTGGQNALDQFLKDNLKYPQAAQDNNIEGTIFVDFVITETGKVREVVASDTIGEDMDSALKNEAIRVVSSMPGWKAGTQHGRHVDASFSIPITFELAN